MSELLGIARFKFHEGKLEELEAGEWSPSWETWDRICKLFGWPQTFAG